ncbi:MULTISPECIES: STAS/SEC14 domain-containing protein [Marinobacter]|uniref:STAS/SEC14 domain-containing protein n=1 Tax=Marinobacter TaxID=2742 RepID=UPI000DAC77AB|nr:MULTISPECIES: STAS/SEC14 domain-containing protein [Marinobacter]
MLKVKLEREAGIAVLEPEGALTPEDFQYAAQVIDPYIEENGPLPGLLVHVRSFPGWASLASMLSHLRFVRDHHRQVRRVALVTDSGVLNAAETLGSHFLAAEIRTFGYDEMEQARAWLLAADRAA